MHMLLLSVCVAVQYKEREAAAQHTHIEREPLAKIEGQCVEIEGSR